MCFLSQRGSFDQCLGRVSFDVLEKRFDIAAGLNIVKEYCKKNGYDIRFNSRSEETIILNGKQYAPFVINLNLPLYGNEQ